MGYKSKGALIGAFAAATTWAVDLLSTKFNMVDIFGSSTEMAYTALTIAGVALGALAGEATKRTVQRFRPTAMG